MDSNSATTVREPRIIIVGGGFGGIAAARQPTHFRASDDIGQQERALFCAVGARPSDQEIRGKRVEQYRRRRPGRKYAGDSLRGGNRSAGSVRKRQSRQCPGTVGLTLAYLEATLSSSTHKSLI